MLHFADHYTLAESSNSCATQELIAGSVQGHPFHVPIVEESWSYLMPTYDAFRLRVVLSVSDICTWHPMRHLELSQEGLHNPYCHSSSQWLESLMLFPIRPV